jgi:monovalent cation:H+ antiporter-2, CPA2 family
MVVLLVFMVAMRGTRGGGLGMAVVSFLIPALTGLSVIALGGRLVMRPLFRQVAAAGSTEFFMAACLLVVIGTGVLTAACGLPMGLGAFIAGILLTETKYRHENRGNDRALQRFGSWTLCRLARASIFRT